MFSKSWRDKTSHSRLEKNASAQALSKHDPTAQLVVEVMRVERVDWSRFQEPAWLFDTSRATRRRWCTAFCTVAPTV